MIAVQHPCRACVEMLGYTFTITTRNKWGHSKGTLICRRLRYIVISAKPPDEVAMIIVAIGKLNADARM